MPDGFLGTTVEKDFDLTDQKAVLTFIDTASGANHTITLPAPIWTMFLPTLNDGLRVDPVVGAAMAADLSTVLGVTLVFAHGHHIGKK